MIKATLLRRYKRFLADVRLADGQEVTVHCPNPGAMQGLDKIDSVVGLIPASKTAKLPYRWQLVKTSSSWVGIDTGAANKIVLKALQNKLLPSFISYPTIETEVTLPSEIAEKTRLDFCLSKGAERYFLEVKSVTLRDDDTQTALFPDTRTERGLKHLQALISLRQAGFKTGILYLVQREDCVCFDIARSIDPAYAKGYNQARQAGVDIHVWACQIEPKDNGIRIAVPLPLV